MLHLEYWCKWIDNLETPDQPYEWKDIQTIIYEPVIKTDTRLV